MSQGANIAIVGAGPAGLMAAEVIARELAGTGATITLFDRMPSPGRKLLMAGRGGLNLTHSEPLPEFLTRYGAARERLTPLIEAFSPRDLRDWAASLGQSTFVGTSGRVFPNTMKASPLLRVWLRRLAAYGVTLKLKHRWVGWSDKDTLLFEVDGETMSYEANVTVLALGGASWPRLGSDGSWVAPFEAAGIAVTPLKPANGGFAVEWTETFRARFAGVPLKRIAFSFGEHHLTGEAVITARGLEGGVIYALSAPLRDSLEAGRETVLHLSLRPDLTFEEMRARLEGAPAKQSLANTLRRVLRLSPVAIGLLHEAAIASGRRLTDYPASELARLIAAVPIRLAAALPIEEAISTAGGVAFEQLDDNLMLRDRLGVFIAGEMLDWEAPTGGYLLQASLSTGVQAAQGVVRWLAR